ncbi:hypothetical protein JS562_52985, partial [Agrobacterium sp. S2]|nr:hypothetical protein [Agrobacterium sp. S2]
GHPYFTQVLCDRIVRMANERRQSSISESLVHEAAESLMSGRNRLDPYRFDCLLSADNSGLVMLREDEANTTELLDPDADLPFQFLARLAALQGASAKKIRADDVVESDLDEQVLNDLIIRDVVESDGGLSIRVHLFSEYLRRNS